MSCMMVNIKVVFPEPDSPTIANESPLMSSKLTDFNTLVVS